MEGHLLQLASFTGFILIIIILLQKWLLPNQQSSPPSPPKLPILGHLLNLGTHPHMTLQTYARRYGPLFLLHLGTHPTVVISSSQTARQIMKTHDLTFANRPKSAMSDKLLYNSRDIAASPYGEYWRQIKTIAVLHLLSNKRVRSFRGVREEEVKLMIGKVRRRNGNPVNLTEAFSGLTNDVVCRVALGRKYGMERFERVLLEFGECLGSFCVGDFVPWLGWIDWVNGLESRANRVAKELDGLIHRVIQDHGHGNDDDEHKDFVDILLSIQTHNSLGFPIQMDTIKALILDMFAAGTDTTYAVLEWAMSELLKHPETMKKLQKEIREIVQNRAHVNEDDLQQMHYLKAIIKETLRLHPPIPLLVPRESTRHIKLNGYDINPGTRVIINAWAIGRDPQLWEEPEEFKPERFMNSLVDFKGQNFELIPFGAGRRGCPGIVFASVINEIALANLVHNFEWELPNGTRPEDLDMSGVFGLTIHRKFPLVAIATPCERIIHSHTM